MKPLPIFLSLLIGAVPLVAVFFYVLSEKSGTREREAEEVFPLSYITDQYFRCRDIGNAEQTGECMHALAIEAYDAYGAAKVAAQLDSINLEDRVIWCHEIMHYVGWRAYQKTNSIADAFLESSELCDSGMYHGVMEEYVRVNGNAGNIEALITTACGEALKNHPSYSPGTESLCYHGLGHGLMYITGSDLSKSLDYCDYLDEEHASTCYGGAFMEQTSSKQVGPAANKKEHLEDASWCEALKDHQKEICYHRQGVNNFSFANGDVEVAMRMCLDLDSQYQHTCFLGVGVNNPAPSKTHTDSALNCVGALGVSAEAYEACIEGSLGFVVQLDRGAGEGAHEFCSVVDEGYKPFCYTHMGIELQPWLTESVTLEERCAVIDDVSFQALCLGEEIAPNSL